MYSAIAERLKTAFPESEISWVAEKKNAAVLYNNPYIDKIYSFDRNKGGGIPELISATLKLKKELKGKYFDYVIDCHGRLKNLGIIKSVKYGKLIGFAPSEVPLSLFYDHQIKPKKGMTYTEKNDLLAEYFKVDVHHKIYPHISISDENREFASEFISNNSLERKKAAIVFATSKENKYWAKEKWIELINILDRDYNADSILFGAKSDLEYAGDILKSCKSAYSVVGKTSLQEAMAVLEMCDLTVAVDTALMHFSVVMGIPSICLFGADIHKSFCPERNNFITIHKPSKNVPCRETCKCEGAACMKNISVENVILEVKKVLQK